MSEKHIGKVIQVIGPVLDIQFKDGELPDLLNAIEIDNHGQKLVDAAVELNANAILASTIISHDNVHYKNMKRINELAVEKGIRDRVIIAAGGTQVIPDEAVKTGIDQGFGRDSHGIDVATFLAEEAMRRRGEL